MKAVDSNEAFERGRAAHYPTYLRTSESDAYIGCRRSQGGWKMQLEAEIKCPECDSEDVRTAVLLGGAISWAIGCPLCSTEAPGLRPYCP